MYKDLNVYQESKKFALYIYQITKSFPKEEQYGLVSQMRRAAVSIPANLAEGGSRTTKKDYKHFVNIARGSCAELEVLYDIARDLQYLKAESDESIELRINRISIIGKMLWRLEESLSSI
jgi:four helix bundle protein